MRILDRTGALGYVARHEALFDAAGLDNPFAGSAFTRHFLTQVARDDWEILAAGDGADAALLAWRDPATPHAVAALTNYYASQWSPALRPGVDRAAALDALVGELAGTRAATVTLAPLADDADARALQGAFAGRGWYVRRYFCFGNWYLPCEGLAFDAYMEARDSRLYNTWTRKAKKFQKGADGARLEIVADPAGVEAAMDAYDHVYARSWKVPEPYPGFVRGWARTCAEQGWLRLGVAWLGDVPIAAQFWFTMNRRAYIFKLAYDEAHTKLSAGTVLSAHLFRHALEEDRVVEMDYLTGDDAYKKGWMTHRRERIGLLACNPRTARGLVAAAREYAGALRQRWRPAPQPAAADAGESATIG